MINPIHNEKMSDRDWPLILATAGLIVLGGLFIFSAAAADGGGDQPWHRQIYFRQVLFYAAGIGAAALLCAVDYNFLARWSAVFYWAGILLLIAVLALGVKVNGGRRWINVGIGFNLQPSEFAKIGVILMLANYLSRPLEELRQPKVFWGAIGLTALPFGLIVLEPDLGSAIVMAPVCLAMMFVAGAPKIFLARIVGAGALAGLLLVVGILFAPPKYTSFIPSYQQDRVLTYFGKNSTSADATEPQRREHQRQMKDKAYNVDQALISVGSGGLWGKGWRQGTQYSLGFLPKAGAHNDFIFSVIAEEEGFVGSVVILTLYTALLFSGIKIASQARDRLGKLMAVGVVALLFSHVFINIGMNIRLMPVTGIPLPLLSYGGSSVVCSLIAIGILHNIHMYRRSY